MIPLDADDELASPDAVSKLVQYLVKNRQVGLVYANERVHLTDGSASFGSAPSTTLRTSQDGSLTTSNDETYETKKKCPPDLFQWEQVSHPVAYWKELWETLPWAGHSCLAPTDRGPTGYDESYPMSADYDFYLRMQEHTYFGLVPEVLYVYHLTPRPTNSPSKQLQMRLAARAVNNARQRRLAVGIKGVPEYELIPIPGRHGFRFSTREEAIGTSSPSCHSERSEESLKPDPSRSR